MIYREPRSEDFPRVEFLMNDRRLIAPTEVYLCDTCSTLRSRYDVYEEIESYYCPSCLENLPVSEAMVYYNRCAKCFECPRCSTTLSVVAATNEGLDSSGIMFYYCCSFCRWDSKTIKLTTEQPEFLASDASKHERECDEKQLMSKLVDIFRRASQDAVREKEVKARVTHRTVALLLAAQQPEPLCTHSGPWRLSDIDNALEQKAKKFDDIWGGYDAALPQPRPYVTIADVLKGGDAGGDDGSKDEVGRDALGVGEADGDTVGGQVSSKQVDKSGLWTVGQLAGDVCPVDREEIPLQQRSGLLHRIKQPHDPQVNYALLRPCRKPLLSLRSRRCRTCKRFVIKSQISPTAIPPFRMNNIAMERIPQLTLKSPDIQYENKVGFVEFILTNPLSAAVKLRFSTDAQLPTQLTTVDVLTKSFELSIDGHDEMLDEIADDQDERQVEDDPEVVIYRRCNRVLIRLQIKPKGSTTHLIGRLGFIIEVELQDRSGSPLVFDMCPVITLGRIGVLSSALLRTESF